MLPDVNALLLFHGYQLEAKRHENSYRRQPPHEWPNWSMKPILRRVKTLLSSLQAPPKTAHQSR